MKTIIIGAVAGPLLALGLGAGMAHADPNSPPPGQQQAASVGSIGDGAGAFGAFGTFGSSGRHDLADPTSPTDAKGANGYKTGLNNSTLVGNRQGNLS